MKITVRNLTTTKGYACPNHILIKTHHGTFYQAHNALIAYKTPKGRIMLDSKYYKQFPKHLKYFTNQTLKNLQTLINEKEIQLISLNPKNHTFKKRTSI